MGQFTCCFKHATFQTTILYESRAWFGQDPPLLWGVVTNRLEKGTFMNERVLKIPGFLTSSGLAANVPPENLTYGLAWSGLASPPQPVLPYVV